MASRMKLTGPGRLFLRFVFRLFFIALVVVCCFVVVVVVLFLFPFLCFLFLGVEIGNNDQLIRDSAVAGCEDRRRFCQGVEVSTMRGRYSSM